jgi:7-cyano-7-deazaguanine synthase in queuosine biosynthesis
MTGDLEYIFDFLPGHSTSATSLFDNDDFTITPQGAASVVLFSGGLDSLAGVLERLHSTNETIYLMSHRSGQPSTRSTQKKLAGALEKIFPGRIRYFSFDCGLSHHRAHEETQRSRAFLFGSIAFTLANRLSLSSFFAYENGVTSLNLLRRQDLINARASRTTHPKTHALMSQFLSELQDVPVKVVNPFWMFTKTDIFKLLGKFKGQDFIGSAVSCSKTFKKLVSATHCGGCFQCIDRRLAAYASGMNDLDNVGIYSQDIFIDSIDSPEIKTTVLDYIRQAVSFAKSTNDGFYMEHLSELVDIVDYIDAIDEPDAVDKIWRLCNRHGKQVIHAIQEMRRQHDDPCVEVKQGSLLQLIADREYLKYDPQRLAEQITETLTVGIPIAFKTTKPRDENDLNNQIDALIRTKGDDFRREFPITQFAIAKVIPDHEARQADLIVEAKYIRKNTSPSKASDGIAADITKYPKDKFILFVVYDPDRAIADDKTFKQELESKRECLVSVIR